MDNATLIKEMIYMERVNDAIFHFMQGMPPSLCDEEFHLAPGTTHDEIISMWAADKAAYKEEKRQRKQVA